MTARTGSTDASAGRVERPSKSGSSHVHACHGDPEKMSSTWHGDLTNGLFFAPRPESSASCFPPGRLRPPLSAFFFLHRAFRAFHPLLSSLSPLLPVFCLLLSAFPLELRSIERGR